jgi:signal transduction histidine kinase
MAATKPCLLVIDDEPDLVQSVQDLLRRDYKVLTATRASEGLELIEREQVHIVMSDQRMPEMTGVELLCIVKQTHPEAVRLLFTAYSDLNAVVDAINEGNVYRYISKPWEVEDLKQTLKQAYDHYQLQEERRVLLQELQAKNAQLESANADLRRANELKKAFIKVASHELRTPLTVLLGYADLSIQMTEEQPELQPWLKAIRQAGHRLSERVDQIIKLMMAERFERPLQPREVDAAELVRSALSSVQEFVATRKQRLEVTLAEPLGTVNVEQDKIHDSLVQLLINAIKFTPNEGTIGLSASRAGERLQIAISDTGMGIEPENVLHVFDPFFTRFDVSRHSSGSFEYDKRGLGLGLSVAKAFVEMHQGKLTVASELGKGTTFTIDLPACPLS